MVDGGDKIYAISRLLKYRWNKEANVTVNGPVGISPSKEITCIC